jgi:hypothetical protein
MLADCGGDEGDREAGPTGWQDEARARLLGSLREGMPSRQMRSSTCSIW